MKKSLYNWLMGKTFQSQFLMGNYPNWIEKKSSVPLCGFGLLVTDVHNNPIGKLLKLQNNEIEAASEIYFSKSGCQGKTFSKHWIGLYFVPSSEHRGKKEI